MLDPVRFTLTSEHVALLRRAVVSWQRCEFGAPAIDCKRPYGNGDVYDDMAEILGIPVIDADAWEDEDKYGEDAIARMDRLHAEMQTALQVVLRCAAMAPGVYVAPAYTSRFERVDTCA